MVNKNHSHLDTVTRTVETVAPTVTKGQHGGAREGGGRPLGSTHKLTATMILATAEKQLGKPLHESIIEGYVETIRDGDRKNRLVYENMLLNKVVAHLATVEIVDTGDTVAERSERFKNAIAQAIVNTAQNSEDVVDVEVKGLH